MLALLVALALVTGPLRADEADPHLAGYNQWTPVAVDSHVHPANLVSVGDMIGGADPAAACVASYLWCDDMADRYEAAGVSMFSAHHSDQLTSAAGDLTAWKGAGEGYTPHVIGWLETYPTSANGLPCSSCASGYTDVDQLAQWDCAADQNEPGRFLSAYGIEWTTGGPDAGGDCGDDAGEALCGGHKTVTFQTDPGQACADGVDCADESALYTLMAAETAVGRLAHPTAENIDADLTAWDAVTAISGVNTTHIRGYEMGAATEDVDCSAQYTPNISQCGYRQMLSHGYNMYPSHGSDDHGTHADYHASCRPQTDIENNPRSLCLATSFTIPAVMSAMQARRCYWAASGFPLVELLVEGDVMGQSGAIDGTIDFSFYAERRVGGGPGTVNRFFEWEIVCGAAPADGSDGGAAVPSGGSGKCESGTICSGSGALTDDSYKWCYLRIESASDTLEIATAPVVFP